MIPDLPKYPATKLTTAQRKAFDELRELLTDVDESDRRYDALPSSKEGKIISTDIARHLDKRYAKEPPAGKARDLVPSWDLAWRYAQNRLEREISNKGSRKRLRLMAGGWGAGKTFALRNEPSQTPDLIWDGTLGDLAWTIQTIDQALNQRWRIEVVYVYRDLELAIYGAVERKKEVGRGVPLEELPKVHCGVQQNILKLTDIYQADSSVSFLYLHNLGIKGIDATTPKIDRIDLEQYGALHYLERHEHYYTAAAKSLEEAH